ncbi:DUF3037 domain-containing protein [Fictibacillus sp. 7GRE50]|uniref:DUF3037 domain-containing protein n=1 Tax=Fictibacillus sp. 7GRE50 TaxID=2745878 RepID=UPI0018CCF62E|nr:DUF3037 domain-containing protein [Fictibacillus sp. 7GRE50]MBH0166243.1 DUF3037 domain-containing protein [Fictibacillus sp. 7GRE50]
MARIACKFAVIQYMPDVIKQELINVGVVMHCPEQGILKARFLKQLQKITKIFTSVNINEYRNFKNIFNRHLKISSKELIDSKLNVPTSLIEYLDSFSEIELPKFIIKKPQPMLTENPLQKLDDLFNLYVFEEDRIDKREQPFVNTVWEKFKGAGLEKFIKKEIELPDFPITIDYGYQNGQLNLIQPIKFTDQFKDNFKEGLMWKDAIEIKNRSESYKDSPFYAVVKPPANPQKVGFSLALDQFRDYEGVEIVKYGTRQFNEFLDHIKEHGHELH